jgi:hypothetical protein
MTAVCICQVFEEIQSQQVIARDVLDLSDKYFSCAKYFWATWKAHTVMSNYVRHQFYEHPSVAAVLASHLADNHVKPDVMQSTKITQLDKGIKNINGGLDYLAANIAKLQHKDGTGKPNKSLKGRCSDDDKDKSGGN